VKVAQGVVFAVIVLAAALLIVLWRTGGPKADPAFYPYGNQVRIVALPNQGMNKLTTARVLDHDDEFQPDTLPSLPTGMTVQMIVDGDAIFHGVGGCFLCHGEEATGVQQRGSAVTNAVLKVPVKAPGGWDAVDSLILNGIPEAVTRSSIGMPPRGIRSSLNTDQVRRVAAYIWAISQTRGEPWPGGHANHATSSNVTIPKTSGP
jgi:mono/diheme cytochrome c family protein